VVTEEKGKKRLLKKHFHGEGDRFGKSQQKLSLLTTASDLPSLLRFCSLQFLSIPVALATVALGPASGPEFGREQWGGEGTLSSDDSLPAVKQQQGNMHACEAQKQYACE
jgi:hypothetical protein